MGMHFTTSIPRDAYMKNDIPVAGCAYQAGTAWVRDRSATSVLDTNCKAHEVDNLYVVDTGFFLEHRRGEPGADRDAQCTSGR